MKNKLNSIVFAGTPPFAAEILQSLLDAGLPINLVLTQPDRPKGRGRKLSFSAVKDVAVANDLAVVQPKTLKDPETQELLKTLEPDLIIVVAYGLLLPQAVLDIPKFGCVNVHASLLPNWRGAAPIQYSLLHGDPETGITIMQMDKGMDTGDILLQQKMAITTAATTASLSDDLAQLGSQALHQYLQQLMQNSQQAIPQDHSKATHAKKITKADAAIDWHDNGINICNKIRAFNPWPVAFSFVDGQLLKIYQAELTDEVSGVNPGTIVAVSDAIYVAAADKIIKLLQLQSPGGKVLAVKEFINGHKNLIQEGKRFLPEVMGDA